MKKKPSKVSTLPAPPSDEDVIVPPSPELMDRLNEKAKALGYGPRELRVVHTATKEVVRRVDVSGKTDQLVQKCMSGMLRNMADEYHVEDSADDKS